MNTPAQSRFRAWPSPLSIAPRPARALLALLAAASLAACGGGGDSGAARQATAACGPASDALAEAAVKEYVKLQTDPYPQRFLIAAGTDSALPESGVRALQDKGPTYFFPADSVQRRKVRAKLDSVGTYNTLLVAYKGLDKGGDTLASVRLSGTFVGGKHDGTRAPARAMRFSCDSTGWHYTRAEEEPRP